LIARPAGSVGVWNDVVISAIAIAVSGAPSRAGTFIAALVETIAAHGTGRSADNRTNDGSIACIAAARIISDYSTSKRTYSGTRACVTFHIAGRGASADGTCQDEQPD
jgi:hypothetical protein